MTIENPKLDRLDRFHTLLDLMTQYPDMEMDTVKFLLEKFEIVKLPEKEERLTPKYKPIDDE